ncbi:hypothetical protein PAPYR_4723 [Paratrimastix pyriformis]|uniref:Uncharacterized protein n=1 Tax=Paratrimastix pyriformis TaxID=342808 RepID=A0ABQ8UJM0_9EUKA|nr:hypothetical protein PAPYR_4723 [Paratrimastix pyriformis]
MRRKIREAFGGDLRLAVLLLSGKADQVSERRIRPLPLPPWSSRRRAADHGRIESMRTDLAQGNLRGIARQRCGKNV